jgi:hypothetical protein
MDKVRQAGDVLVGIDYDTDKNNGYILTAVIGIIEARSGCRRIPVDVAKQCACVGVNQRLYII